MPPNLHRCERPGAPRQSPACHPGARSILLVGAVALVAGGCAGPQSALDPAGLGAERIAALWWGLVAAGGLVWCTVVGLTVYAIRVAPGRPHPKRDARRFILGGTALTIVVLTVVLVLGLRLMPGLVAAASEDAVRIHVTGEEFWWRIAYLSGDAEHPDSVAVANELRLPVDRPAVLELETADVIHAFWLPALGGKIDLIPGRTTRLLLEPSRLGAYRGTCAEFCGLSHAFMSFTAVVDDSAGFEAWLEAQAAPAVAPTGELARRGRDAFGEHGCDACHSIRGTGADGRVGPDLTHVGGRTHIAAGRLPADPDGFARWIRDAPGLKPGTHMPAFGMLPPEDVRALAAYLDGLE